MPRKIALLIGVSEYGEGIPSLSAPLNDVAALKLVLENPKMGGFDEAKTLTNPDPTAMRIAVQQIFAVCSKEDLVLLFFSGHGITDDNNKLYFATKGTSKNLYKATSVPASFVQDISLECYAKRQAIILDCCFSGAFAAGWQNKSIGLDLERELGAEGRVVLTSSTATQKSFQQEDGEFSLYTQYILEGITTGAADKDSDGKIYAQELHEYAKAKVQEVKPKQKPEIINDKEGFNILISQAPINDPELSFRKVVEKYAFKGEISIIGHRILKKEKKRLGITEDSYRRIVDEVLAPHRQYLRNVEEYKDALQEVVEIQYPLTERLLDELQELQDYLGLEEPDIAKFQAEIFREKEAESQSLLESSATSEMTAEQLVDSGLDKRKKGDHQGAIDDYTKAIALSPNYFSAYFNRGFDFDKLGNYRAAIADYNKAIELNPDYAIAYNNRGVAHKALKEYHKAIADYNKAIELNPYYVDAYYNRGNDYKALKEYHKAIADYDKAISLKTDYTDVYNNRGIVYYKLENYQKAMADYDNAIELNPDYANSYYSRGLIYESQVDKKIAIQNYQKAAELYKRQGNTEWYQNAINQIKKLEQ